MAEPDDEGSWTGCVGVGVALLIVAAVVFALGRYGLSEFDPNDRCAARETGRCLRVQPGFVESAGGVFDRVTVRYDDGRQKETVTMAGRQEPPKGSRVRIEWWDDRIVALYDVSHERRYRTTAWPEDWDTGALVFVAFAVLCFVIALVAAVGERRAARSNGKA